MSGRLHIVGAPGAGMALLHACMAACFRVHAPRKPVSLLARVKLADATVCTWSSSETHLVRPLLADASHWFIFVMRDARDLAAIAPAGSGDWRRAANDLRALRGEKQVMALRYEGLLRSPDQVQEALARRLPFLEATGKFSQFLSAHPPRGNGRVGIWRDSRAQGAPALVQRKPTIVVVEHPYQERAKYDRYAMHYMIQYWRDYFRVQRCFGAQVPDGDIGFLHVDQTVIPEDYLHAMTRFPIAINTGQRDISKRQVSTNLLSPGSDWRGAVFVKSDLNSQGAPESSAAGLRARPVPYQVLESLAAVPEEIWRDPRYVVEKFMPERDARGYYVRNFFFLGEQGRAFRQLADDPIVKGTKVRWREMIAPPPEIWQAKRRLGMDFGKFDYVVHEGRVELLDANRTPAWSHAPSRAGVGVKLGSGIWALLGREMPHSPVT